MCVLSVFWSKGGPKVSKSQDLRAFSSALTQNKYLSKKRPSEKRARSVGRKPQRSTGASEAQRHSRDLAAQQHNANRRRHQTPIVPCGHCPGLGVREVAETRVREARWVVPPVTARDRALQSAQRTAKIEKLRHACRACARALARAHALN